MLSNNLRQNVDHQNVDHSTFIKKLKTPLKISISASLGVKIYILGKLGSIHLKTILINKNFQNEVKLSSHKQLKRTKSFL